MNELTLLSAIMIGLAGGVHCIGMCGGIVSAFSYAIPVKANQLPYVLAYNIGRIFSYTLAGAATGLIGSIFAQQVNQGIIILQFVSGVFLFILGLYIADWWRGLVKIERLGGKVWRLISPWSKRFVPFKTPLHALPYGMIWGWLPCGLVYSTLTWALASGSAAYGAVIMAGFGLGTLPIMLLMAIGFEKVRGVIQHPYSKAFIGLCLMLFAVNQIFGAISGSIQH